MGDEGANTDYGEWANYEGRVSPRETVFEVLGHFADDYDVDGLTAAYVEAVNGCLPEGVSLHGRMFFGPYPMPDSASDDIRRAISSVGFTEEILLRYCKRPTP